jgi:hypothetical protein
MEPSKGQRDELRDLISEANKQLAWVHGDTKAILVPSLVRGLELANNKLLEALRIIADWK